MSFIPPVVQYQRLAQPVQFDTDVALSDIGWMAVPQPNPRAFAPRLWQHPAYPTVTPSPTSVFAWFAPPPLGSSSVTLFQYQASAAPVRAAAEQALGHIGWLGAWQPVPRALPRNPANWLGHYGKPVDIPSTPTQLDWYIVPQGRLPVPIPRRQQVSFAPVVVPDRPSVLAWYTPPSMGVSQTLLFQYQTQAAPVRTVAELPAAALEWYVRPEIPVLPQKLREGLFVGPVFPVPDATPSSLPEWWQQPSEPVRRRWYDGITRPVWFQPVVTPAPAAVHSWYVPPPMGSSTITLLQYQAFAQPPFAALPAVFSEICCIEFEAEQWQVSFAAEQWTTSFDADCSC